MALLPRFAAGTIVFLQKINNFTEAVLTGFWLGVLSGRNLERYNDIHYDAGQTYVNDTHNLSGLQLWEYDKIKKFFSKARTFLIIGAGGGRETAALRKWEREVDSYECSKRLVDYGNDFMQRNNIDASIHYLPKNTVPEIIKKYDGIIIGWGAYSHIQGSLNRIHFLSSLKPFFGEGTRIMFSFMTKEGHGRKDRVTTAISNFFRFFTRRPKTETGDRLLSYFAHFFDKTEIDKELNAAGYVMLEYSDKEYGCAVAERNDPLPSAQARTLPLT